MSGNVQEVVIAITEIVGASGRVSGSRLSTQLKARLPSWNPADFGLRSLREFVVEHVAAVVVAGRSGMDVIYALQGTTEPLQSGSTAPEVDFWRVWVSPNSPHALAVDRSGAELRAVARKAAVSGNQVLVEPAGVEVHREVARAFLPSVPPLFQARLGSVLDSPSDLWWQAWLRELRGTGRLAEWNAFRRQQLENRLATRLHEAGLEQPAVDGVLKLVRERHVMASPRTRRPEPADRDADAALRRLVCDAVQKMSAAELRELRLPLGIVLDAMTASKSR